MILIIISIILTIGTAIAFYLIDAELNPKMLLGLGWLLLILFGCFTTVPANKVGIRYNPLKGGTQSKTVKEGFYFKNPLEKIYKLSTRVQEFKFENISIQTKDSQYVNSVLQAQARIDKSKAFEYFKKYGNKDLEDIKSILSNTIQKEFEKVTTQYNIMEVLGEKRDDIVNKTLSNVKKELLKDGILVERIILVDTDAGAEVEKAISNEAIAKKEVETAEYKKEKAQIEGEAKVIEAQKEKEANELLNKTLTKEILIQQYLEKWDGKLPVVSNDNNMIDISSLLK